MKSKTNILIIKKRAISTFITALFLAVKMRVLSPMLVNGLYHLVRMYRVQLGMAGPRVTTAFDEHKHIVRAISNRDPELAEILMRRHIQYSKNNIATKLASNQSHF